MSGGIACRNPAHRPQWTVTAYKSNRSVFNGYHETPSEYSEVACLGCLKKWRTRAAYVEEIMKARGQKT